MNNLINLNQNNNNVATMTSLQIAEMLGTEHRSVKRSIERLIDKGVIAQSPTVNMVEKVVNNREYKISVYIFEGEEGKRDSIIAIAQLSPQHTAIIVDRWIELEEQLANPQPKLPTTYLEALKSLVESEEKNLALSYQVEEQNKQIEVTAPKVAVYDKIIDSTATKTATQVGSEHGISAQLLNKLLDTFAHSPVYDKRIKQGKAFTQGFIRAGLGVMKVSEQGYNKPLFTTKGEVFISKFVERPEVKAYIESTKEKTATIKF